MYIKGDFGSKACGSFLLLIFRICHAVLSVNCSLVTPALLYVMFSCVFVTFPCGVHCPGSGVVLECIDS